jgi:hypothetical protein
MITVSTAAAPRPPQTHPPSDSSGPVYGSAMPSKAHPSKMPQPIVDIGAKIRGPLLDMVTVNSVINGMVRGVQEAVPDDADAFSGKNPWFQSLVEKGETAIDDTSLKSSGISRITGRLCWQPVEINSHVDCAYTARWNAGVSCQMAPIPISPHPILSPQWTLGGTTFAEFEPTATWSAGGRILPAYRRDDFPWSAILTVSPQNITRASQPARVAHSRTSNTNTQK